MCPLPARTILGLALVIVVLTALGAAAPPRPVRADDWSVAGVWHTVANGDDVRALARDGDALWAATQGGGVVHWSGDGTTLRQYLAPQDGLPCNEVRDVVAWHGQWWFATCDGLAVYDAARDRMASVAASLPSPSVTALTVDTAGRLWVATEPWWDPEATPQGATSAGAWVGGGVACTTDGVSWQATAVDGGLPSANVRDVVTEGGAVWVATEPYPRWRPAGTDPDGGAVSAGWDLVGGGVGRYDGTTWRTFDSSNTPALSDSARVLAVGPDALWVGTGGRGLVAYAGGKWMGLDDCGDERRCIQDNFVTALTVSPDGAVWVGTARFNGRGTGVDVLDDRGTPTDPSDDVWRVYGAADGLPGELVHAVLADDRDASLWFGVAEFDPEGHLHGRGLAHLLSDRQSLTVRQSAVVGSGSVAGNDVTALARNPADGALWVGTERSGVSVRRPDGTWRTYTTASTGGKLGSDSIADIAIEPSGVVWVATRQTTFDTRLGRWADGGLNRFDGTTWSLFRAADSGLPADHLSALVLDGRGKLWVGTGATVLGPKEHAYRGWGLATVDTRTQRWERTFTFPTLTSNNITDLVVSGNLLWVATAYFQYVDTRPGGAQVSTGGGVSVYNLDTGQWRKITSQQGLTPGLYARSQTQPLLDLRAIEVDATGGVWVAGMAYPEGRFDPDVTPDGVVDAIGTDKVTAHRFPRAGAMVALKRDPTGYMWAGSASGGLYVWVGNSWIHRNRTRGGLPASDLTAFSFEGGEVWLGTAGHGLINLVDPSSTGEVVPGRPTPTATLLAPAVATATPRPVIQRLPNHIFLPTLDRNAQLPERPTE